jgi:hypothetical protein
MPFIPPMLATRLEDPRRLADPRYSAEPKLDGQRAQLHVRGGRTFACYSGRASICSGMPGWPGSESCVARGERHLRRGSRGR